MKNLFAKGNTYRITVEEITNDESQPAKTLQFEAQDRENMFHVVEALKKGSGLEPQEATRVAVALRLLGPVMMQNRKHPLFADFMPHFKDFMINLKKTMKEKLS